MATPFEQFIQDELPKRAALETNTSVGYDDDPNLPAAPTALKNAPRGTYYLQGSGLLWFKSIAGTATWVLSAESGSGGIDTTEEDFTLTLSLTGTDPTLPLRIRTQAESDAWGAFRTIGAALDALPDGIQHFVTVQLPLGVWDTTIDGYIATDFNNLNRFRQRDFGSYSGIKITGDPSWVQLPGTPTMSVQGSSGGTVTLQAPHGLPAETYKTYFLLVTSGTGAGQYKPIYDYSGSQILCAGYFSPVLTSSSVVQVVEAATTINIVGDFYGLVFRGDADSVTTTAFFFSHLNFSGGDRTLRFYKFSPSFEDGCRFAGVNIHNYGGGQVRLLDTSLDIRGYNKNAILMQYGSIRFSGSSSPTLFQGNMVADTAALYATGLDGSVNTLLVVGAHRFQGWVRYVDVIGPNSYCWLQQNGGYYLSGDQLADTAVSVTGGAKLEVASAAGFAGSTFKGALSDFDLDGEVKARWAVLNVSSEQAFSSTKASNVAQNDTVGVATPTATLQAFTITMDSAAGIDPTFPLKLVNQAQATAWGAFKTIKAALAALPDRLAFNVTLQFPAGTWDLTMQDFYDFNRLRANGDSNKRTAQGTYIELTLAGDNSWLQAPGTPASMPVQSETGDLLTLQSDPGLTQDVFMGYWLLVTSGTGAGQYKAIRYHSGTSIQVTQAFSPALNATSVVQIVSRPTIFRLVDQDDVATYVGYTEFYGVSGSATYSTPNLTFARVDITGAATGNPNSSNRLGIYNSMASFNEGTRIIKPAYVSISQRATVLFDDVVFFNSILTVSGSAINTFGRTGVAILFCSTEGDLSAVQVSAMSTNLAILIFLCDVIFQGFTKSYYYMYGYCFATLSDGTSALRLRTDGAAEYAVELRYGARVLSAVPFPDLIASTFRGTLGDVLMDQESVVTWEEVNSQSDKRVTNRVGTMIHDYDPTQ